MENGFKILWTDYALNELSEIYEYLELNFSQRELNKLSVEIENVLRLISKNPRLFPISATYNVRRVVIKKYNTMYFIIKGEKVEILSFFSNRKGPANKRVDI